MMNTCCNPLSAISHQPDAGAVADQQRSANVATEANTFPSSRARRAIPLTVSRWSLPTLILILLPKCPACLAAYIAVGTGVSLTMAASSYLRILLIVVCVAAIALNVALLARKWNRHRQHRVA